MQQAHTLAWVQALCQAGITFITGVPDSEFRELITELEQDASPVPYLQATREDNAIALAVGAYLAGHQPLVFMESSGIGNAVDALTSMAGVSGIPLVLFIAWAGYEGRDVPHHNAIGLALIPLLEAIDVPPMRVALKDGVEVIVQSIKMAIEQAVAQRKPVAVVGIPPSLDK